MLDIVSNAGKPKKGDPVIKIDWKLPARLRRPVRQELRRQQRSEKVIKGVAGFSRRAIKTPTPIMAKVATGKASGSVMAPPYAGKFSQSKKRGVRVAETRRRRMRGVSAHARVRLDASDQIVAPMRMNISHPDKNSWGKKLKKLMMGGGSGGMTRNLSVFVLGCVLLSGVAWHLQGAGRGVAILGRVAGQADEAYGRIAQAQEALANQDFAGSSAAFADAASLLKGAELEMNTALASSKAVLELADVTGTVRSGTHVLEASEAVTRAGQHFSLGASFLFTPQEELTLVEALGRSQPELQRAEAALQQAEEAIAKVEVGRLPESVRDQWELLSTVVPQARLALTTWLDQMDVLWNVLGVARPREYLIAFQNNHELRPTGGFVGSIALVNVDEGVVESVSVQSVYDPDGQLQEFIAPPHPLLPIAPRWWLRDANWFVDYALSAKKMAALFEKSGGPSVDGVIAMTPEVIERLLSVVGPIDMSAYGVTVTADNFVALTQDQVTYNYDKEQNKPKQFLADLTPVLMNRLFSTPSEKLLDSLSVLTNVFAEKHMLLYFSNEDLQQRVEQAGWGGRVKNDLGNYLYVNNANIGGHKSDQFVTQEIDMRTDVARDGEVEVVLTVRRTHRGPEEELDYDYPEGENPAYRDNVVWQRVLVPLGAELIETQGFSSAVDVRREELDDNFGELVADPTVADWERGQVKHASGTSVGEESGKTFFANWMITPPGSTTVGLYRYRLPSKVAMPGLFDLYEHLAVEVVKQPGDVRTQLRTEIRLPESLKVANYLPSSGVTQTEDNSLVYRGVLSKDILIGVVYGDS